MAYGNYWGLFLPFASSLFYPERKEMEWSWDFNFSHMFKGWEFLDFPDIGRGNKTGLLSGSLVAQLVKNLPAMQETWVPSLGWEDPLEKGMAAHSRILAWRISWTEEPGGLQSMGGKKWVTTEPLTLKESDSTEETERACTLGEDFRMGDQVWVFRASLWKYFPSNIHPRQAITVSPTML